MAMGAALSFAFARGGILEGFRPEDITMLRFGGAGLIFLPLLLRDGIAGLAGIGWRRGLVLTLAAGPLFSLLQTGGYVFAPLAHGAVLAPMSVTVFSSALAILFLKERHGPAHLAGTGIVLLGLALVSAEGLLAGGGTGVWIGDLLFIASSVLWAGYTILLRHWRLDALKATAVVSVLSLAITAPVYVVAFPAHHLLDLPLPSVVAQAVIQGALSGALTMVAYSRAVVLLGAGRAVLFPAMVPGLAIVFGIPMLGEIPSAPQLLGLACTSTGLMIALGILRLPRRHHT